MAYAWTITRDYVDGPDADPEFADPRYSNVGTAGPYDAPDHLLAALAKGKGYAFAMYDDDGELYYRGRGIADPEDVGSEPFCYGPLGDFGAPNAGAVVIRWHGHPEWECG